MVKKDNCEKRKLSEKIKKALNLTSVEKNLDTSQKIRLAVSDRVTRVRNHADLLIQFCLVKFIRLYVILKRKPRYC